MVGSKLKTVSNNNLPSKFCCKIFLDVTLFLFFFRWERWFFFPLSFSFSFCFSFFFVDKGRGSVDLSQREKLSHLPSLQIEIQERNLCICLSTKKLGPSRIACPVLQQDLRSSIPNCNPKKKKPNYLLFHILDFSCEFCSLSHSWLNTLSAC